MMQVLLIMDRLMFDRAQGNAFGSLRDSLLARRWQHRRPALLAAAYGETARHGRRGGFSAGWLKPSAACLKCRPHEAAAQQTSHPRKRGVFNPTDMSSICLLRPRVSRHLERRALTRSTPDIFLLAARKPNLHLIINSRLAGNVRYSSDPRPLARRRRMRGITCECLHHQMRAKARM